MTDETKALATTGDAALIERAVIEGDLSGLTPRERVSYYGRVCESLGLNPFTKPFAFIRLNNKLVLYAQRDATDQLRKRDAISVTITERKAESGVYVVTARATNKDGRTDESTGVVPVQGLTGEALANAYMKAETKAKRRVTLSIVGLGWLDETEIASVPDARVVVVNQDGVIERETPQDAPTGAKPPGAVQTTGASEKAAPTPLCDTCGQPTVLRPAGTSKKTGKAYGPFHACATKLPDGSYCPGKPVKPPEAKTAPLPLTGAPPEPADPEVLFDKSYANGGTPASTTEIRQSLKDAITALAHKLGKKDLPDWSTMTPATAAALHTALADEARKP